MIQGKYNDALRRFLRALTLSKQKGEEFHSNVVKSYQGIIVAYTHLSEYEKALKFSQDALNIACKIVQENNPILAGLYNNMAGILQSLEIMKVLLYFTQKL